MVPGLGIPLYRTQPDIGLGQGQSRQRLLAPGNRVGYAWPRPQIGRTSEQKAAGARALVYAFLHYQQLGSKSNFIDNSPTWRGKEVPCSCTRSNVESGNDQRKFRNDVPMISESYRENCGTYGLVTLS
jgi:hypothetical protein